MSKRQKKSAQKSTVKSELLENEDAGIPESVRNSCIENIKGLAYKQVPGSENFLGNKEYFDETNSLIENQENYVWKSEEGNINNKTIFSNDEEQVDDVKDYGNPGVSKMESNVLSSLEFIWSEIRSENVLEKKDVDYLEVDESTLDDRIPKNVLSEVYQVPKKLEYLLNFSMLLCFDTILYDLTFLPINSVIALVKFVLLTLLNIVSIFMFLVTGRSRYFQSSAMGQRVEGCGYCEATVVENDPVNTNSWGFMQKGASMEQNRNRDCNSNLAENSSVEYIFENRPIKSKSLMSIPEYESGLRLRFHLKSRDNGFLGENSNFLPQIKNHIHSYRMSDQRSSLEELELQSIPSSEIFYDEISNDLVGSKNNEEEFQPDTDTSPGRCFRLTVIELTDLSRFLVLLLSIYVFSRLDISFFYHYFRGQGLLKLYVIFNMLEIFEKLFRSFGRDLIDAYLDSVIRVFSNIRFIEGRYEQEQSQPSSFAGLLFDSTSKYFMVIVYLLIHCTIHMIRGLALNISLNSSEYTMFLIVITNNFAEIKSTVFKTYHSISLFTISCSDTIERFQLLYDGCILFVRMYSNARLYTDSIYSSVITWVVSVYLVEIIVDWFKHSFLVKFNKINSDCYCSYFDTLIGDVLLSRGSSQAFQYLTTDYNKKSMQQGESSYEKLMNKNHPWNSGRFCNNYNLSSKANSNASLSRQGTCSLLRGNTIGLEADVSLNQNKEVKAKKVKNDDIFHKFEPKLSDGDPIFISKRLRGVYAFPYIVSRRIGFVSLPLTILLMCVLLFSRLHSALCINHIIIIWLILFILKYFSSFLIVSVSQNNIDRLKGWSFDFNKINAL